MSDAVEARAASTTAGIAQLRETAKWMIGGVIATAAGVFAGSSLTNLGALDFSAEHRVRLCMALGGAAVGFLALGVAAWQAIGVLTSESFTLRELAGSTDKGVVATRTAIESRYRELPGQAAGFADLVAKVDRAHAANPQTPETKALVDVAAKVIPILMADAGFHRVRRRFMGLVYVLIPCTIAAIIGFGVFAWAANPPAPQAKPPRLSISAN